MRLSNPNLTDEGCQRMEEFAAKVLQVGEQTGPGDRIHWPDNGLEDNTTEALIDYVYLLDSLHPTVTGGFLKDRAILATTNYNVAAINESILREQMTGQIKFKMSVNALVEQAARDVTGPEILNGIENASLPPHTLSLKIGCPVMCLWNLDPVNGLCNGTCLQVNYIGNHSLRGRIIGGKHQGKVHLLPQIPLQSPDNDARCPYFFKRTQFPVWLAYAMTINKSQGQTLQRVGISLKREVFSHRSENDGVDNITKGVKGMSFNGTWHVEKGPQYDQDEAKAWYELVICLDDFNQEFAAEFSSTKEKFDNLCLKYNKTRPIDN
ncbi:MAG: hypothetical protein FRX48_01577 [Lasallia pustulata]|uniref:DNA helicase Pif1-like 2B domain-containing protein n=1 Tax=Lasallia pustulata TaxID=136370 RepID=A0A5M8PZD9_9LECA|nr:MAG: hypothetical protein FRX48_01577 [Lasallia pustulata]